MPKNEQGQIECINKDKPLNGFTEHNMVEMPGYKGFVDIVKDDHGNDTPAVNTSGKVKMHGCLVCGYVELELQRKDSL